MSLVRITQALLAAPLLALAGCDGGGEGEPLSAVLITLDTTRADALSCYGDIRDITPNLDRMALDSVVYDSAYTTVAITLPSHASMLTGLYPLRHTVRDNAMRPLPESADTLAEAARTRGVQTAAFIAAIVLTHTFGLDQGFDVFDEPAYAALDGSSHISERTADQVVGAAIDWLRGRDRERPFFLWVHLFDPHGPFTPPPRFSQGIFAVKPYLGEVAAMDDAIGTLLEFLDDDGALDESLVVVVADHGEAFGEHGEQSHGPFTYDTTMRVPLIVRYPDGYRAGERSDEVVSVVDVHPTLADAMGLAVPSGIDGESLYRRRVHPDRGVYFESYSGYLSYGWSPIAGWVDAQGKYVHSSQPQFFEPRRDPDERVDLIAERLDDVPRYLAAIDEVASRPALTVAEGSIDAELVGQIQKLGYASGGTAAGELPHPTAPSDRPSPVARTKEHAATLRAMELNNLGRFQEAEKILRDVLRENPDNYFALDRLGISLIQQKRHAEAVGPLTRLLREGPQWSYSYFNLGVALMETDRRVEAVEALLNAVRADANTERDVRALIGYVRNKGLNERADYYAEALGKGLAALKAEQR